MIKHHHYCNQCNKSTDDPRKEKGWITINEYGLTIYSGSAGGGLCRHTSEMVSKGEELDFCSLFCMIDWLLLNHRTKNTERTPEHIEKQFRDELLKEVEDHLAMQFKPLR